MKYGLVFGVGVPHRGNLCYKKAKKSRAKWTGIVVKKSGNFFAPLKKFESPKALDTKISYFQQN